MEKMTFYEETEGISLGQMVRYGRFGMRIRYSRNQYETFYIIKGGRLLFFNNREYVARSRDLILMDTNLIHMIKSVTAEDTGHNRVTLYVSYDRMGAFDGRYPPLQLVRFFHGYYRVYRLDKEQQALFPGFYRNLRTAMAEKTHNYKVGVDPEILTWLFKIASCVSKQESASPHPSDHPKYRTTYAIASYLSENYEQNMSPEELVAHFYLSKYHVCRTFKEITGYTVTKCTSIHCIRKARRPLEETDMSIPKIAYEPGYENLTYSERMLKLLITISSSKYCKTLNTVTYTNKQTTEFEEDAEQLSSHQQP